MMRGEKIRGRQFGLRGLLLYIAAFAVCLLSIVYPRHAAPVLMILLAALTFVLNLAWMGAKGFLRQHGWPASMVSGHWRDLRNLKQFASSGGQKTTRRWAARRRELLIVAMWAWFTCAVLLVICVSTMDRN